MISQNNYNAKVTASGLSDGLPDVGCTLPGGSLSVSTIGSCSTENGSMQNGEVQRLRGGADDGELIELDELRRRDGFLRGGVRAAIIVGRFNRALPLWSPLAQEGRMSREGF